MKHLFSVWEDVKLLIKDRILVLFLDFDGTLCPIMSRPSMVRLTAEKKEILRQLSHQPDLKVGIISGRALSDVKERVGVPGILYAGNHGLELEGPNIRYLHPAASEFRHLAKKLVYRLKAAFAFLPDMIVESKTFSVSVHYRQVPEDKIGFAKMILFKEIGTYLGKKQLILAEGKKIWEIRPPTEWNKGKTVLWLLARVMAHTGKRVLPVYVGDDVTDEDAFQALHRRGLTIKVADDLKEASAADYYVWSPDDVFEFIRRLMKLRTASKTGKRSL